MHAARVSVVLLGRALGELEGVLQSLPVVHVQVGHLPDLGCLTLHLGHHAPATLAVTAAATLAEAQRLVLGDAVDGDVRVGLETGQVLANGVLGQLQLLDVLVGRIFMTGGRQLLRGVRHFVDHHGGVQVLGDAAYTFRKVLLQGLQGVCLPRPLLLDCQLATAWSIHLLLLLWLWLWLWLWL